MQADVDALTQVTDVGPVVAGHIRQFFANPDQLHWVQDLIEQGIAWESARQQYQMPWPARPGSSVAPWTA